MKSALLSLVATVLVAFPLAAETPNATPAATPAPLVVQPIFIPARPAGLTPEKFEAEALAWIKVLEKVGLAAIAVVSGIGLAVAMLWQKVTSLHERADRQAANTGSMQEQINRVAVAVPPPPPAPPGDFPPEPVPRAGKARDMGALVAGGLLFLFLSGCSGMPQRSYSVYGRDAQGNEVGGRLELADTRGLSK